MNENEITADIESFGQSLTIGELAIFESLTGKDFGDDNLTTRETLTALAAVAATRLGHNLSIDDLKTLSVSDVEKVCNAAAKHHPPRGEAVSSLLASLGE